MERMENEDINTILYTEHINRYKFAIDENLINGKILDVACGTGYSYELLKNIDFSSYIGIDLDEDAVKQAISRLTHLEDRFIYENGSITDLKFEDNFFDTIISFETLEHIYDYEVAIKEIFRVLKTDGVFIGSVPFDKFEIKCEKTYGENPYHVVKFNKEKLYNSLNKYFRNIEIIHNTIDLSISFRKELDKNIFLEENSKAIGCLYFICTNDEDKLKNKIMNIKSKSIFVQNLVDYDEEKSKPLYISLKSQEKMIIERDKYIQDLELKNQDLRKAIETQTKMIDERDICIKSIESLINEKDKYIRDLEDKYNKSKEFENKYKGKFIVFKRIED